MAKSPRKVSLIAVKDFPKEKYSAYWLITVDGDDVNGYTYRVEIIAFEPVSWLFEGKVTEERPDHPMPAYPHGYPSDDVCKAKGLPCIPVEKHLAHRDECIAIYEAHPKPLFDLEETAGSGKTRDEVDTAAQQWVLDKIENYRRVAA